MHSFLAADVTEIRYIYIYSGALIALVLAAFGGYSYFKQWMRQDEVSSGGGFTLSDLRRLHEQGKMSDAEYELARGKMVASARKMTQKLPEVLPGKTTRIPPAP